MENIYPFFFFFGNLEKFLFLEIVLTLKKKIILTIRILVNMCQGQEFTFSYS